MTRNFKAKLFSDSNDMEKRRRFFSDEFTSKENYVKIFKDSNTCIESSSKRRNRFVIKVSQPHNNETSPTIIHFHFSCICMHFISFNCLFHLHKINRRESFPSLGSSSLEQERQRKALRNQIKIQKMNKTSRQMMK